MAGRAFVPELGAPLAWGYRGLALLPRSFEPYLSGIEVEATRIRKQAIVVTRIPGELLVTKEIWKEIDFLGATQVAARTVEQLLNGRQGEAITTLPFLDRSIEREMSMTGLPLMNATCKRIESLGICGSPVLDSLDECSFGDLLDCFDNDVHAALDVAMTAIGTFARPRAGSKPLLAWPSATTISEFGDLLARELLRAFYGANISDAHVALVTRLFGWGIGGPTTLDEAGKASGLTRERVRQIRDKIVPAKEYRRRWVPPDALADVLTALAANAPLDAESARVLVTELAGGAEVHPATCVALGEEVGIFTEVLVDGTGGVRRRGGMSEEIVPMRPYVWDASGRTGFAALSDIRRVSSGVFDDESLTKALANDPEVLVLGDDWYFCGPGDAAVVGCARRMLTAASELSVRELRDGFAKRLMSRDRVLLAPEEVLLRFFEAHLAFSVVGDRVSTTQPWPVSESERQWKMVSILRAAPGGAMHLNEIAHEAGRFGIPSGTVIGLLTDCELFKKVGPSVYTVVGTSLPESEIGRVRARGIASDSKTKPEICFPAKGLMEILCRLNRKALNFGVIPLPSNARRVIGRARVRVRSAGGRRFGYARVGADNFLHGLEWYLRSNGAREGDLVRLTFDLEASLVVAEVQDS